MRCPVCGDVHEWEIVRSDEQRDGGAMKAALTSLGLDGQSNQPWLRFLRNRFESSN